MYLKSIEMQGFKSFAGKMTLEFHDGVTAIVGPNGSGKSNVADAVRWVLGEQSAKQLRGGNMQDVIFAGTESRKPLGFASVAITLDNSDHKLNIGYDTVTVSRRLYRSGESEYKINGGACRLKDIQELFYDTGIGKEGYSMIGQGQIDRILSGKPEERRELFDEAAGIVKFKRRKLATLKKLEKEEANLTRLTDILTELTRQVGPLEKQSEKARIYLQKRDALKERDIAVFLLNEERIEAALSELEQKYTAAKEELEEANQEYDRAKQEYERIDALIGSLDQEIGACREKIEKATESRQEAEATVSLLAEQTRNADANRQMFEEQMTGFEAEEARRRSILEEYRAKSDALAEQLTQKEQLVAEQEANLAKARQELEEKNNAAEQHKNDLIALLNSRGTIKEKSQRYLTLNEQIEVRQSDLTGRMLRLEQEKKRLSGNENENRAAYEKICRAIEEDEAALRKTREDLAEIKQQLTETDASLEESITQFHRQQSLLESLTNLAERYEGYGNSVRRVMEQKDRNPGILGVVAELFSTAKQYETAIETALGGSLQNIVTDNEATAKYLIEYLKRGRYGRATFLPLTAVREREAKKAELTGEGVIGLASDLVTCEERFKGLAVRLLGKTWVIDTIDHAIALGRLYRHQHRMVTLEGELISPGGAMTGGSYKNSANLLGRQRQIEELKEQAAASKKAVAEKEAKIASLKENRNGLRETQSSVNDRLQQMYLDKNTAEVNLKAAVEQTDAILRDSENLNREKSELLRQKKEISDFLKGIDAEMDASANQEQTLQTQMQDASKEIEEGTAREHAAQEALEKSRMDYSAVQQQQEFARQNADAAKDEIERIHADILELSERMRQDAEEVLKREAKARIVQKEAEEWRTVLQELNESLTQKLTEKEAHSASYKALFARREDLAERRSLLDKESYRLESAIEKNESEREKNINYLWEEYELTPDKLQKDPADERSRTQLQKEIAELRSEIRGLGSVNVNAIEEYKEVKERHDFLSLQVEDLIKAAENLKDIITRLDQGMHDQFTREFANIQKEFNKVFKQLFGGGMGTLELVEDADILEAGIRIIAQPPGKKLQNMMQLSGGEKTLTAIALLFAIQNLKPSPFCLLDEIEAALDDANVDQFARYLHRLANSTQFIVITHRRGTMTSADRLYGITMQEKGISTMVSVDLIESQLS